MWNADVKKSVETLEQFSFLEVAEEKIALTPYMLSYIDQTID